MSKKFRVEPLKGIDGEPIRIPEFDGEGNVKIENEKPVMKDGSIIDMADILIKGFPQDRLTLENITHATRLMGQVIECKNNGGLVFEVEEAEHDWIKKMLRDDTIGAKVFRMNLLKVIEAFDEFERLHEKEEEGAASSG